MTCPRCGATEGVEESGGCTVHYCPNGCGEVTWDNETGREMYRDGAYAEEAEVEQKAQAAYEEVVGDGGFRSPLMFGQMVYVVQPDIPGGPGRVAPAVFLCDSSRAHRTAKVGYPNGESESVGLERVYLTPFGATEGASVGGFFDDKRITERIEAWVRLEEGGHDG